MEASADRPGEESSSHVKGDVLFSDSDILVYQWIVLAVVCQMIDIFGISANVINIICFMRQGFHDPVNVSLLGKITLSISSSEYDLPRNRFFLVSETVCVCVSQKVGQFCTDISFI